VIYFSDLQGETVQQCRDEFDCVYPFETDWMVKYQNGSISFDFMQIWDQYGYFF